MKGYFALISILSNLTFSLRNSVGVFFSFGLAFVIGYFQVVRTLLVSFFYGIFSRISVCIIFFIFKLYYQSFITPSEL